MGIVTNYNIPTGTTLSIKFILYNETAFDNNQRVKPMEMEGEVRYNIPGEHGEHRLGVSFTNISEENKAAINSFVRMVK
jgi:c-di-GMP-binding flagellar brake protein YcgR